ncbi:nucleotidyl transferase AbiEii/AbiGii toxin family protein [Sphingomonas segetis]|jgi:predicted nucleotidyltransferase component of viral defense system|uniref:nucleotidyl transferase AbiEii/AbiGii toxin family protein n=1 Tax=Sphingomonas segetis TaxID=1104779 RepID=UPI0012D2E19B|nr:nucleotidyl transferase AbiEii/AbiGii toxin family protein [Sphingomonas segetis]
MSDPEKQEETLEVDLTEWSAAAAGDPQVEREREATEVFLAALGMTKTCHNKIYLKGGILVGAIYASGRNTADLDFSTTSTPDLKFPERLSDELEEAFPRAAAQLGFPGLRLRMQSVKFRPRKNNFTESDFPAVEAKFAYAYVGSKQEAGLDAGTCADVLYADISFNEPISCVQSVKMKGVDAEILVYSLHDLVAEKFRALLQQVTRDRYRRQDVFDLYYLINNADVESIPKALLLQTFQEKCRSRGIEPTKTSLENEEVRRRASSEWDTLLQEVDELPNFETAYQAVVELYYSLPWKH